MKWKFMLINLSAIFMGILYTSAGALHFIKPKMYLKIMPPYLPAPLFLVYASGLAEIVVGIMVCFPSTRVWGAWGVIALLVAVFPANLYMYQQGGARFGMSDTALLVRLPVQLVLIAWAYLYTR